MRNLFNIAAEGGSEIVSVIGLISSDIDYTKWEPVIPLGVRDVVAIIGHEAVEYLSDVYAGDIMPDEEHTDCLKSAVRYLQQAVALFTWLKIIPTLDAQHDNTGRSRRLGENEKGLTALQEYKDEANILRLAYEATDALVEIMEINNLRFWTESEKSRQRKNLLIQSKDVFDQYYHIGSHRLYITLIPIIREIQGAYIAPVLGPKYLKALLSGEDRIICDLLRDPATRAVALLTMQKAIERLPVEVIPEGVVQIQQSQPVNSRLRAEQSARAAVAASLANDAKRYIRNVEDIVAQLEATVCVEETSVSGPSVHTKGMSF